MSGQITHDDLASCAAPARADVVAKPIVSQPEQPIPGQITYEAHTTGAGGRKADLRKIAKPELPSGENSAVQGGRDDHTRLDSGEGGATLEMDPNRPAPLPQKFDGQCADVIQPICAAEGEAVHRAREPLPGPDRFANPVIAQCVEAWRLRQDMVRAQTKLTLQAKAILRRFCAGDKAESEKLWRSVRNGMAHPKAEVAAMAIMPFLAARKPFEDARKGLDKTLAKLGAQLPIAHMAADIRGVNFNTLAAIAGECGDLSCYRSPAAVWKRAGLAVIGEERQRKKAGDAALLHGYAPERHAVFWNISAALIKAQGTGEDAGPYRQVYDARKAYERPRVDSDGHAHNRAMRYMVKRLLREMWKEWRAVNRRAEDWP
jgi:hypothetical protein